MVDILSLMLYIKVGCHPPPTCKFNFTQLMARWGSGEVGGGKGRRVGSLSTMDHLRVTIGHPRVTVGHSRVTIGHLRATMGHLWVTLGFFFYKQS